MQNLHTRLRVCIFLIYVIIFSLNVSLTTGYIQSGRKRARRDSLWQMYRKFDPVLMRLHTDTRECARAITYEPPRLSAFLPYTPSIYTRGLECMHNYHQKGMIINLSITPKNKSSRINRGAFLGGTFGAALKISISLTSILSSLTLGKIQQLKRT